MERFAQTMLQALQIPLPAGQALVDIAGATDRYALFKAGPVLSASVRIHSSGAVDTLLVQKRPLAFFRTSLRNVVLVHLHLRRYTAPLFSA